MARGTVFGEKPRTFADPALTILNMHKFAVTNVAADKDIVPSNTYPILGAYGTDWQRVRKVRLYIAGTAKNTFVGANKTNLAQNIQVNINGGAYTTIHSLLDDSLPCGQNATHPILIVADITALMTALTNNIGVKWALAAADSDGYTVTVGTYATIIWEV